MPNLLILGIKSLFIHRRQAIGVPRWLAEKSARELEGHGTITTETGDDGGHRIIVTPHPESQD
jgi:hypothetical protein